MNRSLVGPHRSQIRRGRNIAAARCASRTYEGGGHLASERPGKLLFRLPTGATVERRSGAARIARKEHLCSTETDFNATLGTGEPVHPGEAEAYGGAERSVSLTLPRSCDVRGGAMGRCAARIVPC